MSDDAGLAAGLASRLADGEGFLQCLPGPFRRAVRQHPRRGQLVGWRKLEPVPWSPLGRFHHEQQDPGDQLDYHTGTAYPQDAASQLPVELLAPQPGEVVIDCCAAPGSKSTQIALRLGDEGLLVCCDRSPPRRRILVENLARQGIACAVVTPVPMEQLAERHPDAADAVLVDAPCSGHEPRSVRQSAAMGRRQGTLLDHAARLVRPGGRMVYSTCTPWQEEDEEVVAGFLTRHDGWQVVRVGLPGVDADLQDLGAVRLWPQRQGTEPFFACLLVREGASSAAGFPGRLPMDDGALARWLPSSCLTSWRSGGSLLMASRAAAACALPSQARGLLLESHDRLLAWGAQALIERGAEHLVVPRSQALALWAGTSGGLPPGMLVASDTGAPLGAAGASGRLDLPSRLRRSGLA